MHFQRIDASESLVARTIKRGFPLLSFEPALEREYLGQHLDSIRVRVRIAVCLAFATVLGFALMDRWLLGSPRGGLLDMVRYGIHLPIVVACILLTSRSSFRRRFVPGVQFAAPLFGLGSVAMALAGSPAHAMLLSARLVLVTFFFYFMLGLSFRSAVRTNAIVLGGYVGAALVFKVAPEVGIYQTFVLVCANLFAGAGCYALEHANRLAFLERRMLTEVATHDGLTGLLNRAAFESEIRRLWDLGVREQRAISVVMIDIDYFKPYNDRYGHQAGDGCLRTVAAAVRKAARRRPLDFVARYGGEELVAVLYGADLGFAAAVGASILEEVSALRIPHSDSLARPYVTVSVGATSFVPRREESHDLAIRRADQALYEAKGGGRDRCVTFDRESAATESAEHSSTEAVTTEWGVLAQARSA